MVTDKQKLCSVVKVEMSWKSSQTVLDVNFRKCSVIWINFEDCYGIVTSISNIELFSTGMEPHFCDGGFLFQIIRDSGDCLDGG